MRFKTTFSPAERLLERQRRRNLGLNPSTPRKFSSASYTHVPQPVESSVEDTCSELRIGFFNGPCNITLCRRPGATWWNRGSYAHYCPTCARMLNRVNYRDAEELLGVGERLCIEVQDGSNVPFGKPRYMRDESPQTRFG